jgi:hypothetical protein
LGHQIKLTIPNRAEHCLKGIHAVAAAVFISIENGSYLCTSSGFTDKKDTNLAPAPLNNSGI